MTAKRRHGMEELRELNAKLEAVPDGDASTMPGQYGAILRLLNRHVQPGENALQVVERIVRERDLALDEFDKASQAPVADVISAMAEQVRSHAITAAIAKGHFWRKVDENEKMGKLLDRASAMLETAKKLLIERAIPNQHMVDEFDEVLEQAQAMKEGEGRG